MTQGESASSGEGKDFQRRELARFLRARREAIAPADAGLASGGRRRTPGLRREEVALLANIGVAWYSKLEMAQEMRASPETLLAVARALRLKGPEVEYVFSLAGVAFPQVAQSAPEGIPEAIETLIPSLQQVGAIVWDRYLTALRWNGIADAMFKISSFEDPFDRNTLVRMVANSLQHPYYGDDYEQLVRGIVGVFRRAYVTQPPTPFAKRVYDAVCGYEIFQKYWTDQLVADELFDDNPGPFVRNHRRVGTYSIVTTNLRVAHRDDLLMRIIAPADDEAAAKFRVLATMGKPSTRETRLPPPL